MQSAVSAGTGTLAVPTVKTQLLTTAVILLTHVRPCQRHEGENEALLHVSKRETVPYVQRSKNVPHGTFQGCLRGYILR